MHRLSRQIDVNAHSQLVIIGDASFVFGRVATFPSSLSHDVRFYPIQPCSDANQRNRDHIHPAMPELNTSNNLLLVDASSEKHSDRLKLFRALQVACVETGHVMYHKTGSVFTAQHPRRDLEDAFRTVLSEYNRREELAASVEVPTATTWQRIQSYFAPVTYAPKSCSVTPIRFDAGRYRFTWTLSGTEADEKLLSLFKAATASPSCKGVRVRIRGTKLHVLSADKQPLTTAYQVALKLGADRHGTAKRICPLLIRAWWLLADSTLPRA